jgi:Putative transposase
VRAVRVTWPARWCLNRLIELRAAGRLAFFSTQARLTDRRLFLRHLAAVRKKRFVVYAKPPFSGPEAVLAYLSRYTHRVAISNRRLMTFDKTGVTFRYKDYRRDGPERQRVMTLTPHEFIRRFLLHVLPRGFHRIRHYGLLASSARRVSIARARELLAVAPQPEPIEAPKPLDYLPPCPCCGGRMTIIEAFERWRQPRPPPHKPAPTGSSPS